MPRLLIEPYVYEHGNLKISVFDVPDITGTTRDIIDQEISNICKGNNQTDLLLVKKELKRRSSNWSDSQKMGAVAEFFIHLYMKIEDYKQEFLFFNLEESSFKKGFDGLYTKGEDYWIMESKSGENTVHKSKVREAFNDLYNKITTNVDNNPWQNAYNHAAHRDVGSAERLLTDLRRMGEDFENDRYQNIEEQNIMPCATVFLGGTWTEQNHENIVQTIKTINILQGKKIHVVCVTQASYDAFFKYLEEEEQ